MDNVQNNSHVEPQFHLLNGTNLTAPTFINHNYAPQVFQPPNNIESSNISQPQINPENNNEEHKKRKRATKKESDVRNFKCPHCDKSYLSYPALYTHCKQKHNTNNHSGRNRGRPKKDPSEGTQDKNLYDPQTPGFFLKEERTGSTPPEKINEIANKAFICIYKENKDSVPKRKMREYNEIKDHPFLGNFILDEHNVETVVEDEKKPTDKVLIDYLNNTSGCCNEQYFERLIIFVTLFRENINLINKCDGNQEYTVVTEAEDVPEKSNEFITDFLFPEEEEKSFGFDKEECIDLTRNLCNWMYMHNFTCSKLFLI